MSIGIGIDTGGTCTDAVLYDFVSKRVLAKGKALTTRQDLAVGIGDALDRLPTELLSRASVAALSTTLATNACVENRGGRARLALMGISRRELEWIDSRAAYGLSPEDILCIETKGSFDGLSAEQPDWDDITERERPFFEGADALGVAEVYALRNGAVYEKLARERLERRFGLPVVMATELSSGMNVLERGATALLNARLLPVVMEFMTSVGRALTARGLNIPALIVRSDGTLMTDELSLVRPVETIMSGPAASVTGGGGLTGLRDGLVIDMGGTTTDISILRGGAPQMTGGISIGGWRTQIKGVSMHTFGLGGDTRVTMKDGRLGLDSRRVRPLCLAAADWPGVKPTLRALLERKQAFPDPLHELLFLAREPADLDRYREGERELISILREGPAMLGDGRIDLYTARTERLEDEGVIMRCGLTPTDIMHITGDYTAHDCEAAELAARWFLRALPGMRDDAAGLRRLCGRVYELVEERLYTHIVALLLGDRYPALATGGLDPAIVRLIAESWRERGKGGDLFELKFTCPSALIGIGAPTGVFLPEVARALGAECVVPEHAEVANAVGAITADISARVSIEVAPEHTLAGITGYTVRDPEGARRFDERPDAVAFAESRARELALAEARKRGAVGRVRVEAGESRRTALAREGTEIDLGSAVTASATGGFGA